MQDNIYILSITEFLDDSKGDNLMRQAESKVDESRRAKAGRIRQPGAKAASLGAGLLLQLAVQDKLTKAGRGAASVSGENAVVSIDIHNNLIRLSPSQVLSKIETLVPLEFIYGKSGKPYLKEFPFYFNLSHSGEFVVCMVSDREIGVDIQEHRGGDMEKLAKRYFSRQEIQALEGC